MMRGWSTDEGALKLLGGRNIEDHSEGRGCVGVGHDEMDRGKDRKGVGC